jgi:hypothetical protein
MGDDDDDMPIIGRLMKAVYFHQWSLYGMHLLPTVLRMNMIMKLIRVSQKG